MTLLGCFGLVGCTLDSKITTGNKASTTFPSFVVSGPAISSGDSTTNFVYTVSYSDVANVTLTDADITLNGTDTAGCVASVTGSGTATRTVTVTNCSGDGTVSISIAANTATDASGKQTPAYGPSSVATARNSFILTVDTSKAGSTANNQVQLPFYQWTNLDVKIDWGDGGAVMPITSSNWVYDGRETHTYASPGVYEIRIKGTMPGIKFNSTGEGAKILDVKQWGPNAWESMEEMFARCVNLQISAVDGPNLSAVTNMIGMFAEATSFNSPIGHWKTSHVTSMQSMFGEATAFNQPIGEWDVSNVEDFRAMFGGADAFNQNINAWNTSSARYMSFMFYHAIAFNQPVGSWDTSKVTTMNGMFSGAEAFNQSIGNWVTSSVTDMSGMFSWASAFNQPINADSGGRWDTSNVTSMAGMFEEAHAFNQNIGDWNTVSLTTTESMFLDALAFNGSLAHWKTTSLTNMSRMFQSAVSFNQPLSPAAGGVWNTASVTNMDGLFYGAAVFNQDLSGWNVSGVTTSTYYSTYADDWIPAYKPALP